MEILFWLTNTLNNIVALFHKVVFVYKVNWIENVQYYDTKKSIHRYQKLHFFRSIRKWKCLRCVFLQLFLVVFKTLQKVIWHAIFFQEKNSWNTIFPRNLISPAVCDTRIYRPSYLHYSAPLIVLRLCFVIGKCWILIKLKEALSSEVDTRVLLWFSLSREAYITIATGFYP